MAGMTIRGDLNQIFEQKDKLGRCWGVQITGSHLTFIIHEQSVKLALRMLYDDTIEGWHHYEDEYIQHGICTKEEFLKKLKISVEQRKKAWHEENPSSFFS